MLGEVRGKVIGARESGGASTAAVVEESDSRVFITGLPRPVLSLFSDELEKCGPRILISGLCG
jgi:hypothetical protein